jgi:2-C-methyl-D-erythritol 2,4-cyclodiphosphate synthase
MLRIGQGYDIHRLVEGRPLKVGCIEVPFPKGPLGHSDGDAAAHALCDALLGAAGLGDMGAFFPSSDPAWKDTESSVFLQEVGAQLAETGGVVLSADVTVILERPRLLPHLMEMRDAMAEALGLDPAVLSVKCKSNDGLGPVGEGNAIAALAVALVDMPPEA